MSNSKTTVSDLCQGRRMKEYITCVLILFSSRLPTACHLLLRRPSEKGTASGKVMASYGLSTDLHSPHTLFKESSPRLALDMRILIMNICCLYEKVILNGFNIEFMHTWDRARQSTKPRFHFHRKSETLPSQTHCQGLGTRQWQLQASILGE